MSFLSSASADGGRVLEAAASVVVEGMRSRGAGFGSWQRRAGFVSRFRISSSFDSMFRTASAVRSDRRFGGGPDGHAALRRGALGAKPSFEQLISTLPVRSASNCRFGDGERLGRVTRFGGRCGSVETRRRFRPAVSTRGVSAPRFR